MSQRVEVARLQYEEIKARRMELEHRVRLLHPNSLDPDMLDERARLMLNYGHEDDVVVIPDIHVILDHQNGQSGR